jgi:hypothetical protein
MYYKNIKKPQSGQTVSSKSPKCKTDILMLELTCLVPVHALVHKLFKLYYTNCRDYFYMVKWKELGRLWYLPEQVRGKKEFRTTGGQESSRPEYLPNPSLIC